MPVTLAPADPKGRSRRGGPGLRLRRWPPPELPERPYPVLLPYTHPALLAGRDRELAALLRLLRLPVPILGLSATSGAGKSSLLLAGLVPALSQEGRPVAVARHAHEPGLAGRLLGDLLEAGGDEAAGVADDDYEAFVDRLLAVENLAGGAAPILVLDQFEDVLHRPDAGPARAALGVVLAATARRRPGRDSPPFRWLLAYRQEHHGDVIAWLSDVLRDAGRDALADSLPYDLSTPDRFHCMTLPPLATPRRGADPVSQAADVFQAAIEAPLELAAEDGAPRYPWSFPPGGAERLARAFAEARVARPDAPLTPELQVVLAHLLAQAEDGVVEVPEEPQGLLDEALEDHLAWALETAFPAGRGAGLGGGRERAAQGRSRALLALRELASATGRREAGLPSADLCRAIGPGGEEILERLAAPLARLVVLQQHPDGWRYALSHDRMAEVVVRMVEREGRHGKLLVDAELLALRRFVTLNSALYRSQEEPATRLPRGHYRRIAAHAEALLWDAERREWWAACRERRRADGWRAAGRAMIAAVVLILAVAGAWSWARRLAERRALLEQIAEGEPEAAFQTLDRLAGELLPAGPDADLEELRSRLRQRESPTDVLERGMGGVSEERRSAAVLRAVEIVLPLLDETPDDPVLIANLVWALDYAPCRDPVHASRARILRDRVLEPLRRRRPPPPLPGPEDPDWVSIPGGTFWMGSGPEERPEPLFARRERPRHRVTVSPFRMSRHPVTNREYRRFVPDHVGTANLPVRWLTWYQAYTYAAWIGGRLPTEAEWELAARAGCAHDYCTRDGGEATVDQVAWTSRNATDPESREPISRAVKQLEPNPWGLFDMLGNLGTFTADWYGPYSGAPQVDPLGPTAGEERAGRGGCYYLAPEWAHPATRLPMEPRFVWNTGMCVVAPSLSATAQPARAPSSPG